MKRVILLAALLLSGWNVVSAQDYESLRPKFNYSIIRELKSAGEYNVLNLRVGSWIEYVVDSGTWKESIDQRDQGNNLYPPHKIIIVKCVGEYVDGKRNGLWTYYRTYDSRQPLKWDLMETWVYSMGQADGMHKSFYNSGELLDECQYKSGKRNGTFRKYKRDGKVTEITAFADGEPEGKSEHYASNGVLIWSGELHLGFYHGIVKDYYFNGQLRSTIEYKMGKPWNMIEAYTRYGAPLDRGTLKNGTGIFFEYNEGGSRVGSVELLDGKFNGTFRTYFLDGNIEVECEYRNDTMRGVYRDFYPEGGIMHLKAVFDGVVDGPVIAYYRNGKLKSENIYKKGKIWTTVYANDPEGNKIDCGNVKMGSGMLISYDDSGRVLRKERYSFGYIDGVCEDYYPNGSIATTTEYMVDLAHGEYRSYDEEGELISTFQYSEGILDGSAVHYHTNGKIYEELYYYRGRLWEIISIRDSSGKKLNPGTFKNGNGRLNGYYPGGALYSVTEMVHGLSHGHAAQFYESGEKFGEYRYYQDNLIGTHKKYWENGVVAAEWSTNEYGENEKLKQYHSNGKLWTVWEYENALLWNVEANYDNQGNPHNMGTFSKGNGSVLRYDEKDSVIFEYHFINGWCLNCENDTATLY